MCIRARGEALGMQRARLERRRVYIRRRRAASTIQSLRRFCSGNIQRDTHSSRSCSHEGTLGFPGDFSLESCASFVKSYFYSVGSAIDRSWEMCGITVGLERN